MGSAIKKTWTEKLADTKGLPKVAVMEDVKCKRWGLEVGATMVIPAPLEVDEQMRRIPKGRVATTGELRDALARKHGTTTACPMVTGIFAWIAAHAAVEGAAKKKTGNPYWRTLKTGGAVNPKFPGGALGVSRLLRAEGHKIVKRGKRYFVDGYERVLAELP